MVTAQFVQTRLAAVLIETATAPLIMLLFAIINGTTLKGGTPPNFTQRNRVKLKFDVDISFLLVILGNLIMENKGSSAFEA